MLEIRPATETEYPAVKEFYADAPVSEGGAGIVVSDAPVQADMRPERYIHNNRRYNPGAGGGEKR